MPPQDDARPEEPFASPQPDNTPSPVPDQPQQFSPGLQPVHSFQPQGVSVNPYAGDQAASPSVQPAQMFTPSAAPGPSANPYGQPVVSSPVTAPAPFASAPKRKRGRKLLVAAIVVVVIIGLAAGYVFGMYLPNTPDNVYKSSLANTGKGIDTLLASAKQGNAAADESATFDGTLQVKSSGGSVDAKLNGAYDQHANATMQLSADAMGTKFTANIRSIHADGSTSPDLYFQVNGIKSLLDAQGMNDLDSLDGQWIAIDHTVIDTEKAALQQLIPSQQGTSTGTSPTYDQAHDATLKVQAVNKQYLFTTDSSKAVLTEEKFIGRETSGSRTLNHYLVGYNKDHLQAYVTALGQALDSSKLNDWARKDYNKSLSVVLDFSSLEDDIKNAKGDYTFDLWADTSTKLVSKLAFRDPSDSSTTFTVSQDYTGGTVFPLKLSLSGKDDSGNPQNANIGMTLDTAANKVTMTFGYAGTSSDTGDVTLSGTFDVTANSKPVSVTAPAGAKPITDVLNSLGLGGLLSGDSSGASTPGLSSLDTPLSFQQ